MYDELVKRMRNAAHLADKGLVISPSVCLEAADAIENMSEAYEKLSRHMDDLAALMPRWIPVTERLPEFEGAVLCMRKSNVYGVRPHQEILYVDEYGFKNYDDIYLADGVVTHWMPLPEPPKEE